MGNNILRIVLREAKKMSLLNWRLVFFVLPLINPLAQFSKSDSGWVPLFNGENFEGIYGRLYGQPVTDVPDDSWEIRYPGTDSAIIRGSNTNRQGNIGTKQSYSHYRMRVQYRHDQAGDGNNAGITYHTDESKPRMANNWPFSIECQMMQREPGSAYSIAGLAFDTRANGGTYAPNGGSPVTACVGSGCDRRNYNSNPIIKGGTHWQWMEIIVRGADTAWHLVEDRVVFKLWNMREKTSSGFGEEVSSGAIGLQAEGAYINYRYWEIMELPENGPNYLHKLIITSPSGDEELSPGSTYDIKWGTIGEVEKVNIEISEDGENWETVAENIDNNGSYSWTVPSTNMSSAKLRISAEDYVEPGLTEGNISIGVSTKGPWATQRYRLNFYDANLSLESGEIPQIVEFYNVAGHLLHKFHPEKRNESLYLKQILSQHQWGIIFIVLRAGKFEKRVSYFWQP